MIFILILNYTFLFEIICFTLFWQWDINLESCNLFWFRLTNTRVRTKSRLQCICIFNFLIIVLRFLILSQRVRLFIFFLAILTNIYQSIFAMISITDYGFLTTNWTTYVRMLCVNMLFRQSNFLSLVSCFDFALQFTVYFLKFFYYSLKLDFFFLKYVYLTS